MLYRYISFNIYAGKMHYGYLKWQLSAFTRRLRKSSVLEMSHSIKLLPTGATWFADLFTRCDPESILFGTGMCMSFIAFFYLLFLYYKKPNH